MKIRFIFTLLLLIGVSFFILPQTTFASDVVGTESYELSWDASNEASVMHLYFGQADQNKKDTTVNDLPRNSRGLTLSYLKPCTSYRWNLLTQKSGQWGWQWGEDKFFTTDGVCAKPDLAGSVKTATGVTVMPVGNASATVTINPRDGGAQAYHIYYKEAGSASYTYALRVPQDARMVTIDYLNPAVHYVYKVTAIVNGEEVWYSNERSLK